MARLCALRCQPHACCFVDWSGVREQLRHLRLRSSVSVQDRSIALYECVFFFGEYNSPISHNTLLRELASILPSGCCPLIITDAGYRSPWPRFAFAFAFAFAAQSGFTRTIVKNTE